MVMVVLADTASEHGESLPDTARFTLVEDDDVAFTLCLCREVNRLYAGYQEGTLPASEGTLAGLVVTIETLAAMTRSVTTGMPSMRITVAVAQTREMLAVMFDKDPMHCTLDPKFRKLYRDKIAESAQVAAVGFKPVRSAATDSGPPALVRGSSPCGIPSSSQPVASQPAQARRFSTLRRLFARSGRRR